MNGTESDVGCLYAGVPHGSVLGPMQFLIYIKDISDHTYGSCRLFADDTSLGHISNDLSNLQDIVNSDLFNIKTWGEDWLITFNPDKTDIMLFDSRRQGNLNLVWTNRYTGTLLTFINTWILHSVLKVYGHDILTTYYLGHPSKYVFYEN